MTKQRIFNLIKQSERLADLNNKGNVNNSFQQGQREDSRQLILGEAKNLCNKLGYEWKQIIKEYYNL